MRNLVITENITLDGVIDASEGWFAPPSGEADVDQSDLNGALREQAAAADAVLLGRVTFEEMRGFWPLQTNDKTGVTKYLDSVEKYVVSTTMTEPEWQRSTVLSGDVAANVGELKAREGKDIVVTGSITLVHELIARGLVDEYRLFVYPIVIGRGGAVVRDGSQCRKAETRGLSPVPLGRRAHALQRERMTLTR